MKKIEIVYSSYFILNTFDEYLNEKFNDDIIKKEMIKKSCIDYKLPQDMSLDFIDNYLDLFIEKCRIDLRSRNKSSSETNDLIRQYFFKERNLYHHHLISREVYKLNENTKGIKIQTDPARNINDKIETFAHTSGLYLHYQKKEIQDKIQYKLLVFSNHPKKNEWDDLKKTLEILIT